MSVTSVVNLSDGLLGRPATQETAGLPAGTSASSSPPVSALPHDEFTPSSQSVSVDATAQAAGLFSLPKSSALPANTNSLIAPSTAGNANDAAANPVATGSQQTGAIGSANSGAPNANAGIGAFSSPNAATSSTSASSAPGGVAQLTQIDTLNNALAALGLKAADIQKIDRVASLINDFNPTAFTSLVHQLEAQAQNGSAQPAQGAAAASSTSPAAATKIKTANA